MCWGPLSLCSSLGLGLDPTPAILRGSRVAGSGPPAHQNHALHHSILLHQQRRVPLQRAVQVVAQQAVGVMPALPREKGVPVAPMPRRHTEIPMFSARSGSPEPRTTAPQHLPKGPSASAVQLPLDPSLDHPQRTSRVHSGPSTGEGYRKDDCSHHVTSMSPGVCRICFCPLPGRSPAEICR